MKTKKAKDTLEFYIPAQQLVGAIGKDEYEYLAQRAKRLLPGYMVPTRLEGIFIQGRTCRFVVV